MNMTSDIWYRYPNQLSRVQIMKKYSALSSLGSVIVHTVKIDCLMLGNIIGDLTYTNDLCLAGYDVFLNITRDWWNVFTKNTIDWSLIYPSSSSWRVRGFSTIFPFSQRSPPPLSNCIETLILSLDWELDQIPKIQWNTVTKLDGSEILTTLK